MYDVAVIGAGPGGYIAALRAAELGLKTVCIEKEKSLGGTCLNIGCIPSKALLQATERFAFLKEKGEKIGINASGLSVDLAQMMRTKEEVVSGLTSGIEGLFKKAGVEWVKGEAAFDSPSSVTVAGKERIEAKHFILATGSEPIPLPFLPFDEKRILSSTGALSLPEAPKKMAVVGAGAIGLELASVYGRMGSEITVIEMLERACPGMDETVGKTVERALKNRGMRFFFSSKVTQGEVSEKGVLLTVEAGGEAKEIKADVVLVAIGRRPYTKGLNLKAAGLSLNDKGELPVNGSLQSEVKQIYAVGDMIDGPMLAHKASEEGAAAAELIAGRQAKVPYIAVPNVIYTHPEGASVGLTEEQAKEKGISLIKGSAYFKANPRARCQMETEGVVKILGEKNSGRLIGLHIVGPQASELIAVGTTALIGRATVKEIAAAPHAHPTLAEALKEAAQAALD